MKHDVATAHRLAETASVDVRSATKALAFGADAVKGLAGKRIAEAAIRLGLTLPRSSSAEPPHAA